jgi:hypothetical protein
MAPRTSFLRPFTIRPDKSTYAELHWFVATIILFRKSAQRLSTVTLTMTFSKKASYSLRSLPLLVLTLHAAPQVLAFTPLRSFALRSAAVTVTSATATAEFTVGVLGDLHLDPRKMEDYESGRAHWMPILHGSASATDVQHIPTRTQPNVAIVSLGDLGESKNCDHNPANPSELFAGTTICHDLAAEYLGSFGVPYEVVGGNHGTTICVYRL